MPSPAPACKAALAQATKRWPNRDKSNDGIMGDASHQARVSDHNDGNAFDLTHDPKHGVDGSSIAEAIRKARNSRVKYVIHNRRIFLGHGPTAWKWRGYTGSNPHTEHVHVSIWSGRRNDTSDWPGIAQSLPYAWLYFTTTASDPRAWNMTLSAKALLQAVRSAKKDGRAYWLAHCSPKRGAALAAYARRLGLKATLEPTSVKADAIDTQMRYIESTH